MLFIGSTGTEHEAPVEIHIRVTSPFAEVVGSATRSRWGAGCGWLTPMDDHARSGDGPPDAVRPTVGSLGWWAAHEERLRRRRPRADGLTIETIVDAALDIVDADGLDALTMRRLADELSTGSASLYRHVASRDELVVLVIDHVIGEVALPPEDLAGRTRVEWLAHELRRVLLAHPELLGSLTLSPLVGPNARRGSQTALESLLDAGFSAEIAVPAYLALIDYVIGSVSFDLDRGRHGHGSSARGRPNGDRGAARHWSATSSDGTMDAPTSDEVFGFGLRAFLDGLELRRP